MTAEVAMLELPAEDEVVRVNQAPATLPVRLRAMTWEADGVLSLELASPDGSALPPFEAGSHVDLHLPSGTMRQYSLCGDPADRSCYRVAIRAVSGGLSSQFVHRKLRPGEMLADQPAAQQLSSGRRGELHLCRRRHRHHTADADDAGVVGAA